MRLSAVLLPALILLAGCPGTSGAKPSTTGLTADHNVVRTVMNGGLPESAVQQAKDRLVIGYGHTSHGSQVTTGMSGLVSFANSGALGDYSQDLFSWSHTGAGGALHLYEGDGYGSGPLDHDAGYYPNWYNETVEFLENPANSHFNVIMWSWCGQVSGYSQAELYSNYLDPMALLEVNYPDVAFVYMTGHLDGSGEEGNLHLRNEEIRQHCEQGNRWLFDFADIESYDPDGNYYLDKAANDNCDYDSDGNGTRDRNWAVEWQNSHTGDWYSCSSAHSQPLNANMKAYAIWWLFAQIAAEM